MKLHKSFLAFSTALAFLTLPILTDAKGSQALAEDTVNFALPSVGMLYLPVYVADTMGYFAQNEIEPQIQVFKQGGGTAMAAVLSGDMDVYVGSASAALRAVAQGTDAVLAGALMTQYASNVVMRGDLAREKGLTEDSSVEEKLAALQGANIGVTGAGSGTHQLVLYMLTQAGLDPERDATVVFIGGSNEMLAAFSRDRIDAFTLSNPTSDAAIADHGGFLLFNTAAGELEGLDDFLYISANTTRRWLDGDPDRAQRTNAALNEALAAMHDPARTEEARDGVYEKYFPQFEKTLFDSAWEAVLPAYPQTTDITGEQVGRVVEFLNEFSEQPYDGLDIEASYSNELNAAR